MSNRDKIIAAAKEAGFPEWENTDDPEFLKVIEKLYVVAFQSGAASRDAEVAKAFEAGRVAEREACAVVCERLISGDGICADNEVWIHNCAEAIRARGDMK